MMRPAIWSVLALCSAAPCCRGGESKEASWTFVFVVAADCPAPTETRRGLDAVARQAVQLGRRLLRHNVIVLHSPATSAPVCLTTTRRGVPHVRTFGSGPSRDPRAALAALTDASRSCPAKRRAFFFVGHTEEDVRDRASNRLGLPLTISALAEAARTAGAGPFDLVLLHCCYSARIETIVRVAPSTRWMAVSAGWIHPQDLDYRALEHAVQTDDGCGLAERLLPADGGTRRQPQLLVIDADAGRLGAFLSELNSLTDLLRRAVESRSLDPLEIGLLHVPVERSLEGRVDLTALLDYATGAHWVPQAARERASTAGRALRALVAQPRPRSGLPGTTQPVITIGFPWHEPIDGDAWQACVVTPLASVCRWPQLVADAKRRAGRRDGLFLGWTLERALAGQ